MVCLRPPHRYYLRHLFFHFHCRALTSCVGAIEKKKIMVKEIIQPQIKPPDLKDPFTWASVIRTYIEWIRLVGPQLGIDVSKYILGEVLSNIVGDDANAFGAFHWEEKHFDPRISSKSRACLLERISCEIDTPETPEVIRRKLIEVEERICLLDWSRKDEFIMAKKIWGQEVRNWVENELGKNKAWEEAETYHLDIAGPKVSPYWRAFLHPSQ